MQFLILFLSLVWTSDTSVLETHEFHLSKTTINYDSEEKAVQISTKIFLDDLELALKESGYDSLSICTRKEKINAEKIIADYISTHLMVAVDDLKLEFTFLGKEQSDDLAAVWCYLEAYNVESFDDMAISNTILIAQYDDQKNVTMVQIDKERIAHILFTSDTTYENVQP